MTSFSNEHAYVSENDAQLLARTLVVIPALNEEAHIEKCIRSLMTDELRQQGTAMVVADGGSTDATRGIVANLQTEFSHLLLVDNPQRLQSAGINRAVTSHVQNDLIYLVRCDAHSIYPPNFVRNVVARLKNIDAASVVVPMDAVGQGCFGKANAWIVDTPLGNGGSAHRAGKKSGFVEHGHHAGFKMEAFRNLGGYDDTFSHNEDAEFDKRLILSGERIFLDAEIRVQYVPRRTARDLAKQYFNYGKGRARTALKHRSPLRPRQLIPVAALLACIGGLAIAPWQPIALLVPAIYLALLIATSLFTSVIRKSVCGLFAGLASGIMHMAWAAGFLKQCIASAPWTRVEGNNLSLGETESSLVDNALSTGKNVKQKSSSFPLLAWRGLNRVLLMVYRDLRRFARVFIASSGPVRRTKQDRDERPGPYSRLVEGVRTWIGSNRARQDSAALSSSPSMDGQVLVNTRGASAPAGEVIYAIGDVHGQLLLLQKLLDKIDADLEAMTEEVKPVLVFLGDYIDRGLQSKQVIDLLLSERLNGFETVFIAGNHEDALLTFTVEPGFGARWAEFGGTETLYSYGVSPPRRSLNSEDAWTNTWKEFRSVLPHEHLAFYSALQPYHIRGDYIFVHAGLRPGIPVTQQDPQDMMWIRERFLNDNSTFSKLVVHGHTPSMGAELDHRRLGLDTGAYSTGVLTAARLTGPEIKIIST